jgi:quercetin dioxygenase-like cupin family protein
MRIPIAATVLSLTISAFAGSPASVDPIIHSSKTIADQPITLPQGPVEVSASIFTIQPGASLPVHRHAFPRYGYVLTGTLSVSNLETGKTQEFHSGEFIIESVSKWHSGSNSGKEPLELLVIDQAPAGAQTTEVKPQQD